SVIVRSPTFASVFAAISGLSGFGPAEALAEATAVGSLFFFEQAPRPGTAATSATTKNPPARKLRARAAPRAAPSLESIGARNTTGQRARRVRRSSTSILPARGWKGKREAWNRTPYAGSSSSSAAKH